VFLDGWSPEYPVVEGTGVNPTTAAAEGARTRGEDVSRKFDV